MRQDIEAVAEADTPWFLQLSLADEWTGDRFAALVRDSEHLYRYFNVFFSARFAESFASRLGPWAIDDERALHEQASRLASRFAIEERDLRPLRLSYVRLASPGEVEFQASKVVIQTISSLVHGFIRLRNHEMQTQIDTDLEAAALDVARRAEDSDRAVRERLAALDIARQTASVLRGADRVALSRDVVRIAEDIIKRSRDPRVTDAVVTELLDRGTQAAHRVARDKRVIDAVDSYYSLGSKREPDR